MHRLILPFLLLTLALPAMGGVIVGPARGGGVAVTPGSGITMSTNGAGTLVTISGGGGGPQLWYTNASDGSIMNTNQSLGKVSIAGTNAVITADTGPHALDWLFVVRTNGTSDFWLRSDGSSFIGPRVFDDVTADDFSVLRPFHAVTMTDSNGPNRIFLSGIAENSGDALLYQGNFSLQALANPDTSAGILRLRGDLTNGRSDLVFIKADPGGPDGSIFLIETNGIDVFWVVGDGNIRRIRNVPYEWPRTNGAAGKALTTDGGSPQQLYWDTFASPSSVTQAINNNARIGPGTLNFIPRFLNPTNVTDSRVHQVETNQWNWNVRTNYGANTNSWTNRIYSSFTSTNLFHAVDYVINEPGANKYNGIFPVRGSGDTTLAQNKFRLYDSWDVNGVGQGTAPDSAGDWLPVTDGFQSIGNGSKRPKDVFISRCYIATPRDDSIIFGDGYQGHGFGVSSAGSLYFTGPSLAGIQFNQSGLLGAAQLDIGQYGVGFGAAGSNVLASIRYGATAGLIAVGTNSAVNAPTSVGVISANASGSDHGSPDFISGSGASTGTGTNGSWRVQTSEKANATSSTANTATRKDRIFVIADPIVLTTNSATVVFNATIPTALRGFGGTVFAHTEIENGVDIATTDDTFTISANRKGSTVVAGAISTVQTASSTSGGSAAIANTWTLVANAQSVDLKVTCVTSGILSTNSTCRVTFIPNSSAVPVITHP